ATANSSRPTRARAAPSVSGASAFDAVTPSCTAPTSSVPSPTRRAPSRARSTTRASAPTSRDAASAGAQAQGDDPPQDARAVAKTVQAARAVRPRPAPHRHLDDPPSSAHHAEEQVHLDVEPVRTQRHPTQHIRTECLEPGLRVRQLRAEQTIEN